MALNQSSFLLVLFLCKVGAQCTASVVACESGYEEGVGRSEELQIQHSRWEVVSINFEPVRSPALDNTMTVNSAAITGIASERAKNKTKPCMALDAYKNMELTLSESLIEIVDKDQRDKALKLEVFTMAMNDTWTDSPTYVSTLTFKHSETDENMLIAACVSMNHTVNGSIGTPKLCELVKHNRSQAVCVCRGFPPGNFNVLIALKVPCEVDLGCTRAYEAHNAFCHPQSKVQTLYLLLAGAMVCILKPLCAHYLIGCL
ncbi:uncharacterized protein LOC121271177 [Carcharodon carcharias]|uniref:uncharacterized protein LOC121271177 n=1 Tax=Carcharodon carcharias TaxID=13397 RepID=UPI001B7EBF73|nr:uncharacterized protein LOC121271177 [Carcharodon carcharias]